MDTVDAVIIGAGIIGLAIGRALAQTGRSPLILEKEAGIGQGVSSRNSEVIHAGLYYPPQSLKARFCVEGRDLLYDFCEARGVAHRRCGKLIIAHEPGQIPALQALAINARECGVGDLVSLSRDDAAELEPALDCAAALLSPSTGIVDTHGLMLALLGEAETLGANLICRTEPTRMAYQAGLWLLEISGHEGPAVATPIVINAAGLSAQTVARGIVGLSETNIPPLRLARGCYFSYAGKTPFSHLIYPLPEPGCLGTHLTLDLSGQARFGPDIEWIDIENYDVDPGRQPDFLRAARRIWPEIDPRRLQPAYAGIRPKLSGPGEPTADFCISGPADHGLPGLVNLFGIESPGLTASLAIAKRVASLV